VSNEQMAVSSFCLLVIVICRVRITNKQVDKQPMNKLGDLCTATQSGGHVEFIFGINCEF